LAALKGRTREVSCYTPLRESLRPNWRDELKVPDLKCPGLGSTKASITDDFRTMHNYMTDRLSFDGYLPGTMESKDWRAHTARRVLSMIARQAELDSQAEDAKSLLPPSFALEAVFTTLDRFRKGYITDTDFCQFSQDFGGASSFGLFFNLVNEVLLRRPCEPLQIPGRLNLRELCMLVVPAGMQEYEAGLAANSDAELRSMLYLLRHSEPCPRCSIRVQRDADSAGCPSVTCPVCGATFRCFVVVGDFYNGVLAENESLPAAVQYNLFRLLDIAASAANELEQGRKLLQGEGGMSMLNTAFSYIADRRQTFLMGDLRRALFSHDMLLSEQQLGLLWRRYTSNTAAEVAFGDFARQLKPREAFGRQL